MNKLRLLAVLLLLSLSACIIRISDDGGEGDGWNHNPHLRGSGVRASATRTLGEFRRLRVELGADVRVTVGAPARLELSGDDNLLEHVRTRVVDGELVLDTDGESLRPREPLRIVIACPELEVAAQNGSGTLAIEGLHGARFDGSLAGSGDFVAKGEVEHAAYSISGSGDLHCRTLAAQDVQLSLSGSGSAYVRADAQLSVSISGSGSVRYSGTPARITRSVAGSGTIAPE